MSKLDEIQELLERFYPIVSGPTGDQLMVITTLMHEIVTELKRIDAEQKRLQKGFATIVGMPPSCENR